MHAMQAGRQAARGAVTERQQHPPEGRPPPAHKVYIAVGVVPGRPAHGVHQLVPQPRDIHGSAGEPRARHRVLVPGQQQRCGGGGRTRRVKQPRPALCLRPDTVEVPQRPQMGTRGFPVDFQWAAD